MCQHPKSGQKFILITNQDIHMHGLENLLLFLMQHLKGVHVSEVTKFLAESSCVTSYAIQIAHPFDGAHPLINPLG